MRQHLVSIADNSNLENNDTVASAAHAVQYSVPTRQINLLLNHNCMQC